MLKKSLLILFLINSVFLLSPKKILAATFTIDTISNVPYNPITTPIYQYASTDMIVMSGDATPNATISAKMDGGVGNILQKEGFGFPTSRWSVSFENMKKALYNVTLTSEGKTITFKVNVTMDNFTSTITPNPTQGASSEDLPVTANENYTVLLLVLGALLLAFPGYSLLKK